MISLTYLSLAVRPLEERELEELLAVSRDKNQTSDLTGMLLYVDQQFIQTLEGERRAVEATMERIVVDPRHHQVDITLVEEISQRSFSDWTMGFKALDRDTVAGLPGFTNYLEPSGDTDLGIGSLGRAGKFHRAFRDAMPAHG